MMSQRAEFQNANNFLEVGRAKEVNRANRQDRNRFQLWEYWILHDRGPLKVISVVSCPLPGYANERLQCRSSEFSRCMMQLLVKTLNATPCFPSNLRPDYFSLQLALQ